MESVKNNQIVEGKGQAEKFDWKAFLAKTEVSVFIALVVLAIALTIASPYFMTTKNIFNVLKQISIIGILAVGQGLIIMTSGIDLSVGSAIGINACLAAIMTSMGMPWVVVLVLTLMIGGLIGCLNGLIITKLNINPFIVTLGMMSVLRGSTLLITDGLPVDFNSPLCYLGSGYVGPIPVSVIIMFIVVVAGFLFSNNTLTGRNIYAIGNNERSAVMSGINTEKTKRLAYTILGFLSALSGIILAGNLNNADPSFGQGYEMDVIAAVVIGGVSLAGGEGSILGVIIGAALMGILRNGFVLLRISAYWQVVTIGLVIIAAVSIDGLRRKKKA
ncbi:MAG: transporter permease [Clostridia bacterium]|nr:transporter permease [Clostridia bacterium]